MESISGIPYSTAQFDKNGKLLVEPNVPQQTDELIIISHGWNNDRAEAESLYHRLFDNFASVTVDDIAIKAHHLAIVGVIWPSKKFDDLIVDLPAGRTAANAAGTGGGPSKARSEEVMLAAIDRAAQLFDDPADATILQDLRELVPRIEESGSSQTAFVKQLRKLLEPDGRASSPHSALDGSDRFFEDDPEAVFTRAEQVSADIDESKEQIKERADVAAAGAIGDLFSDAANAVQSLLNVTTYYEMKKRAGTVGTDGLAPLVDQLAGRDQLKHIHLVGHSFGARLVSAAAMASATPKLYSLSLLQGAFSHNGFSKTYHGYFRAMLDRARVKGPILVTNTRNDLAVGKAYAIASRISQDNASNLGDANDMFGGIGSNGALHLENNEIAKNVNALLAVNEAYPWEMGKFHNLESSQFIDSHGAVDGKQVAWALSRAIASAL